MTTTLASSAVECPEPATGYRYIQLDVYQYMSMKGVGEDVGDHGFNARIWGHRETWTAANGSGRDHAVMDGPGFDTLEMTDEWLALGAFEPLDTFMFTYDRMVPAGELPHLDLECLVGLSPQQTAEQMGTWLPGGPTERDAATFQTVVDNLLHQGGLSDEAAAAAFDLLSGLEGVTSRHTQDILLRGGVALVLPVDTTNGPEEHLAVFDLRSHQLLEYREEMLYQPEWTLREPPFPSRRETVVASGTSATTESPPAGIAGVVDPDRPTDLEPGELAVSRLPDFLSCIDLIDYGMSYSEAVVYWALQGWPDTMDPNGNGVPCKHEYGDDEIDAFWGQLMLAPLPGTPFSTANQGRRPPSLPSALGALGSGCSPPEGLLPDGIWFGWVRSYADQAVSIGIQCVRLIDDAPVVTDLPPVERDVPIADYATVHAIDAAGLIARPVPFSRWSGPSAFCAATDELADGCPVWLFVNGGRVTEIVEAPLP